MKSFISQREKHRKIGKYFSPKSTPENTHGLSQKIQGTYFKISALYFKIYGLCFLQRALCFFLQGESFSSSAYICRQGYVLYEKSDGLSFLFQTCFQTTGVKKLVRGLESCNFAFERFLRRLWHGCLCLLPR